jgi:hypothetical protein
MDENRKQKLLPRHKFIQHLARNFVIGLTLIGIALGLGMLGYHYFEGMKWLDAYLNAAMILSGMGPADTIKTEAGKLFAGTYALFSGILFLVIIAIIFAPIFHRFFHQLNITDDSKKD